MRLINALKKAVISFNQNVGLSKKIVLFTVTIIIIPMFMVVGIIYGSFRNSTEKQLEEYYFQIMEQYCEMIDYKMRVYETMMDSITVSGVIQEALLEQNKYNLKDSMLINEKFAHELNMIVLLRNNDELYKSVVYALNEQYPSNGSNVSNIGYIKDEQWFKSFTENDYRQSIFYSLVPGVNVRTLSFVRGIRQLDGVSFGNVLGILKLDLLCDEIFNPQISSLDKGLRDTQFLVLDENGDVLYQSNNGVFTEITENDCLNQIIKNNSGTIYIKSDNDTSTVMYTENDKIKAKFVFVFTNAKLNDNMQQVRNAVVLVVVLLSLLIFSAIYLLNFMFVGRVRLLTDKIRHAPDGALAATGTIGGKDEVAAIDAVINEMLCNIDALMRENYISKLDKREAELKALRFQINPHFLYNTLEIINQMAATSGCSEIGIISQCLGEMFRYNLNKDGEQTGKLLEEMRHIQNYLRIQHIRFGPDIHVVYDVPEELSKCVVPKFILQPIVENAFAHGFNNKPGHRYLEISVHKDIDDLVISIYDDGSGIDEERLEQINDELMKNDSTGIGLSNIHARIRLEYGDRYGVRLSSEKGIGTQVQVRLPCKFDV